MKDIAVLLDVATHLLEQDQPDLDIMLELLDRMSLDDIDAQTRNAIAHAQTVTAAALNKSSAHATVALCALARVVALLERQVVVAGIVNLVA